MAGPTKLFTLCLSIITLMILFSLETARADIPLGKVTVLRADGKTDVYPVVSGNKISYSEKSLIRVTGSTFVAEEGSSLELTEEGRGIDVRIDNGIVHFRVRPEKAIISFVTKDGSISTPEIVQANTSIIEGTITVDESGTSMILSDGTMTVLSVDGTRTLRAGEMVTLAQAVIDESEEEPMKQVQADPEPDNSPDNGEEGTDGATGGATGAAVFGTVTAGAITGTIIGASTSGDGGGDTVASPIE